MDITSIIGFLFGTAFIVISCVLDTSNGFAINFGQIMSFVDYPSIMITIGGTICSLMIAFPLSDLAKVPKHLKIIFFPPKYKPEIYIEQITEFAQKARVNGLLALEEDIDNIDDPFMKSSLMMVVDSVEPEKVKAHLEAQLDYLDERHAAGRAIYDRGSQFAPAFGMIGTLIGLINLLGNLDDISSVAPNMAVALITTFYGSIMANFIFLPISSKLAVRHDQEYLCKVIICEGIQGIQAGENPRFIEERLAHLLPAGKYQIQGEEESRGKGKSKGKRR